MSAELMLSLRRAAGSAPLPQAAALAWCVGPCGLGQTPRARSRQPSQISALQSVVGRLPAQRRSVGLAVRCGPQGRRAALGDRRTAPIRFRRGARPWLPCSLAAVALGRGRPAIAADRRGPSLSIGSACAQPCSCGVGCSLLRGGCGGVGRDDRRALLRAHNGGRP